MTLTPCAKNSPHNYLQQPCHGASSQSHRTAHHQPPLWSLNMEHIGTVPALGQVHQRATCILEVPKKAGRVPEELGPGQNPSAASIVDHLSSRYSLICLDSEPCFSPTAVCPAPAMTWDCSKPFLLIAVPFASDRSKGAYQGLELSAIKGFALPEEVCEAEALLLPPRPDHPHRCVLFGASCERTCWSCDSHLKTRKNLRFSEILSQENP